MLKLETVVRGKQVVTVVNETRGTALYESLYKRMLFKLYPDAGAFKLAMDNVPMPLNDDPAARERYNEAMGQLLVRDELGSRYFNRITEFAVLASHITRTEELDWNGATPMNETDLKMAFEHFLSEDRSEGLWFDITNKVIEMAAVPGDISQGEPASAVEG